uniref:Uncharacterized protein n=1 Tax=Physcomitrium patens TaxID=3218 RepID=A0A2K1KD58_PHYPA|nr:hypothetical protein PHYPA_010908 [Physcomitrium patens]
MVIDRLPSNMILTERKQYHPPFISKRTGSHIVSQPLATLPSFLIRISTTTQSLSLKMLPEGPTLICTRTFSSNR